MPHPHDWEVECPQIRDVDPFFRLDDDLGRTGNQGLMSRQDWELPNGFNTFNGDGFCLTRGVFDEQTLSPDRALFTEDFHVRPLPRFDGHDEVSSCSIRPFNFNVEAVGLDRPKRDVCSGPSVREDEVFTGLNAQAHECFASVELLEVLCCPWVVFSRNESFEVIPGNGEGLTIGLVLDREISFRVGPI